MKIEMSWVCTFCNQLYLIDDLQYLFLEKNYSSSSFVYCKNCWKIRYSKYYCQYCRFKFQGFFCLKRNLNVCYRCKCSIDCGKYC